MTEESQPSASQGSSPPSPPQNLMPYSWIEGQDELKLALEVNYVDPSIGGVLIRGPRGTGKSTTVRAFSYMMFGDAPVTLPISATEDRVMGGFDIKRLMEDAKEEHRKGVIERAHEKMLYIDEVNLLEDHLVNIILDVASTGFLTVESHGHEWRRTDVEFALVGTMNPDEGALRGQLRDRFGLSVSVQVAEEHRVAILEHVLALSTRAGVSEGREADTKRSEVLRVAKELATQVAYDGSHLSACVRAAKAAGAEGLRGEAALFRAARAIAAIEHAEHGNPEGDPHIGSQHLERATSLALAHRQRDLNPNAADWWPDDIRDAVSAKLNEEAIGPQH